MSKMSTSEFALRNCTVFVYQLNYSDNCIIKYKKMKPFKSVFLLFSFALISVFANSQDTITRNLDPFESLSIIGKMRVELYKSDTVRAELILLNTPADNIITEVSQNALSIRLKTDTQKTAVIRIRLFYTSLTDILVAANSLLVSPETLTAEKINFTARSGAKMELDLDVTNIQAEVKQGGLLVFSGKTNRQDVVANTGATYSAYELKAEDTYVTANSGSKAKVCAARIIDATSNTKSYVGYIGVPVSVYMKTNLGGVIASFANEDAVFEE